MKPITAKPANKDASELLNFLPPLFIGLATVAIIAALTVFHTSKNSIVAVLFPPWYSQDAIFHKVLSTGGSLVRFELNGKIAIVLPDDTAFEDEITAAGAWAILNPLGFGGCGTGIDLTKNLHPGPMITSESRRNEYVHSKP